MESHCDRCAHTQFVLNRMAPHLSLDHSTRPMPKYCSTSYLTMKKYFTPSSSMVNKMCTSQRH